MTTTYKRVTYRLSEFYTSNLPSLRADLQARGLDGTVWVGQAGSPGKASPGVSGDVNTVILVGRLGSDPELKYTPGGRAVCSFSLATSTRWSGPDGQQERTEWHRVVAWGDLAEECARRLRKGLRAYAEGRLETRSWEGEDGARRYRAEVVASSVVFIDDGLDVCYSNAASSSQLRPFFGYYGGKWRDALKHYPEPEYDTIIEPFAGSAGYSLRYASRKVILCELDPVLAELWRYLIRVKTEEILAIPDLAPDGSVDDLDICQEARWLVGFWLNRGAASPRKSPSKWMRDKIRPGSFWGPRVRRTIASQLDSIRHWKVFNCSYLECPAQQAATWFIDPPYEAAGRHYRFGSEQIDYQALGLWCRSRRGQVIVCENEGATWLPFRVLADVKTTRANRLSREVIWLSSETSRWLVASESPAERRRLEGSR